MVSETEKTGFPRDWGTTERVRLSRKFCEFFIVCVLFISIVIGLMWHSAVVRSRYNNRHGIDTTPWEVFWGVDEEIEKR